MNHRAKRSLGQNFLMHAQTAERIAHAGGVTKKDTVLEIGPGTGMLTRVLLAQAGRVVAIEKDDALYGELERVFAKEIEDGALELIRGDALALDTECLGPYKLVANIPYYITGEIIRTFLSAPHKPSSMTLLVQKEVAERIARAKKESLLSLSVKAYGTPKYAFTVPRGAFRPAPSVDSAVITVFGIKDPFGSAQSEERFFAVLRAGFAHKRKLLVKNLESVAAPDAVRNAFEQAGIPSSARAEDVSLASWLALARAL